MVDENPRPAAPRDEQQSLDLIAVVRRLNDVVTGLLTLSRNHEARVHMLELEALDRINERPVPAEDDLAAPLDESTRAR